MLTSPGIIVTTVQHKEMIAEREIIDALEAAADEVYPGTGGGADEEDGEDGDIEDMLKKELEGLAAGKTAKSPRFRVCKRDTVCGESSSLLTRVQANGSAVYQRPSSP